MPHLDQSAAEFHKSTMQQDDISFLIEFIKSSENAEAAHHPEDVFGILGHHQSRGHTLKEHVLQDHHFFDEKSQQIKSRASNADVTTEYMQRYYSWPNGIFLQSIFDKDCSNKITKDKELSSLPTSHVLPYEQVLEYVVEYFSDIAKYQKSCLSQKDTNQFEKQKNYLDTLEVNKNQEDIKQWFNERLKVLLFFESTNCLAKVQQENIEKIHDRNILEKFKKHEKYTLVVDFKLTKQHTLIQIDWQTKKATRFTTESFITVYGCKKPLPHIAEFTSCMHLHTCYGIHRKSNQAIQERVQISMPSPLLPRVPEYSFTKKSLTEKAKIMSQFKSTNTMSYDVEIKSFTNEGTLLSLDSLINNIFSNWNKQVNKINTVNETQPIIHSMIIRSKLEAVRFAAATMLQAQKNQPSGYLKEFTQYMRTASWLMMQQQLIKAINFIFQKIPDITNHCTIDTPHDDLSKDKKLLKEYYNNFYNLIINLFNNQRHPKIDRVMFDDLFNQFNNSKDHITEILKRIVIHIKQNQNISRIATELDKTESCTNSSVKNAINNFGIVIIQSLLNIPHIVDAFNTGLKQTFNSTNSKHPAKLNKIFLQLPDLTPAIAPTIEKNFSAAEINKIFEQLSNIMQEIKEHVIESMQTVTMNIIKTECDFFDIAEHEIDSSIASPIASHIESSTESSSMAKRKRIA